MNSIKIGKQFFLVLMFLVSSLFISRRIEAAQVCASHDPMSGFCNGYIDDGKASPSTPKVLPRPVAVPSPSFQNQRNEIMPTTVQGHCRDSAMTYRDGEGCVPRVKPVTSQPRRPAKTPATNKTPGYQASCGKGALKNTNTTEDVDALSCVCSATNKPVASGVDCFEPQVESRTCLAPSTSYKLGFALSGQDCECPAQFGGKKIGFGQSCGEESATVQCKENEIINKMISGASVSCVCSASMGFVDQDGKCAKKPDATALAGKCSQQANGISFDPGQFRCYCNSEKTEYLDEYALNSGDKCAQSAAQKSTNQCAALEEFVKKAQSCKDEGSMAIKKCNPKDTDSNKAFGTSQQITQAMSQVSIMEGQKDGSADSCFKAGVIGAAAWQGLDLLKEGCDPQLVQCKSQCDDQGITYSNVQEKCWAEIKATNPSIIESEVHVQDQAIQEKFVAAKKIFMDGIQSCSVEAPAKEADVKKMMTDMNNSSKQAAKCECQLTAGQTSCDQIKGPADCKLNPADPLCPKTVVMKCAGADKDTKECVCLRDPKGATCATNPTGPAQIAGLQPFNPINSGASNITGGGSGSGSGLGDLNSDAVSAKMSGDKSISADSPFGVAAGGSGGGGGSGGADSSSENNGIADSGSEPRSGIGGLFGQLKSGIANAIGGGSTPSLSKKFRDKNGNPTDIDPNQWRPKSGLRGIANDGIGRRNMDIFKMINIQYMNQHKTLMSAQDK